MKIARDGFGGGALPAHLQELADIDFEAGFGDLNRFSTSLVLCVYQSLVLDGDGAPVLDDDGNPIIILRLNYQAVDNNALAMMAPINGDNPDSSGIDLFRRNLLQDMGVFRNITGLSKASGEASKKIPFDSALAGRVYAEAGDTYLNATGVVVDPEFPTMVAFDVEVTFAADSNLSHLRCIKVIYEEANAPVGEAEPVWEAVGEPSYAVPQVNTASVRTRAVPMGNNSLGGYGSRISVEIDTYGGYSGDIEITSAYVRALAVAYGQ